MIITNATSFYNKKTSIDSNVFEEYHMSDVISLSKDKPEINKVVEFLSYPTIKNINFLNNNIDNTYTISNEGYDNNKNKLVVELDISEKLIYTTKTQSGYVYTHNLNTIKNISISIPDHIKDKSTHELIKLGRLQINPYIENIHIRKIDVKNVYRTMLLLVEIKFFV